MDTEARFCAWLGVVATVLFDRALSARGGGAKVFTVVVLAAAGVLAALEAGSIDVLALDAPGVLAPPGRVTRFWRSSVR